jgi:serine protease Do
VVALVAVAGAALYRVMPAVEAESPPAALSTATGAPAAPTPAAASAAAPVTRLAQADLGRQVPQSQAQVQLSFAPLVKEVAPAVVNVYATTITQQSLSPFANDPFFSQLFGGNSPLFQSRPRESESLGSGVIIDPSGIIVTNSHVVNGATDVKVALQDGREFPVDVLVNDTKSDLAVLKVKGASDKNFPTLGFADSDQLEVGDLVLAIGNPFGVGQTVTNGIVSALGRTGIESSDYESFIQTDAPINPGNSGGALVNLQGQLVGINTAIFSKSGGSVGIGFAIPSNMVKAVAVAAEQGQRSSGPGWGRSCRT